MNRPPRFSFLTGAQSETPSSTARTPGSLDCVIHFRKHERRRTSSMPHRLLIPACLSASHAAPGKQCSGEYLAGIIEKFVHSLPAP